MAHPDGAGDPGAGDVTADCCPAAPLRRCLVTGESGPRETMIRFVAGPGDNVVPDLKAVLPGRGMWLSASRESLKTAQKRNLFSRAARRRLQVPEDLESRVEALLARRCLEWLARANRAGMAVAGYEKTRAVLQKKRDGGGQPQGVLLAALDGSENGRQKLEGLTDGIATIRSLAAVEIGGAFGRDAVVHAYVAPGGLADGLLKEANRLAGFRSPDLKSGAA